MVRVLSIILLKTSPNVPLEIMFCESDLNKNFKSFVYLARLINRCFGTKFLFLSGGPLWASYIKCLLF